MRITGAGVNLRSALGSNVGAGASRSSAQVGKPQSLGTLLFGKAKPKKLEQNDFPHLRKKMQKAKAMKRKLAFLAGDDDDEYQLELSDTELAMVDENGTIYLGQEFLEQYGDDDEILAGVLGHELGHRPKSWPKIPAEVQLSLEQRQQLAREEEGKADWFAGRALAELGMAPDQICTLLESLDGRGNPSKEYYSVSTRQEIIREAHRSQTRRRNNYRAMFPDAAKWRSAGSLIADDI